MSQLDLHGQLEVYTSKDGASVGIPLVEPEGDWMGCYNVLARSEGLDAQVAPQPGGVILRVKVSSDTSREQTFQLLDSAVSLIERAKVEANGQREAALAIDLHVKDWWSAQGHSTP